MNCLYICYTRDCFWNIHTYANTHFFVFGKFHWKEMPNFSENAFAYYSVDMSKLIYICAVIEWTYFFRISHTHTSFLHIAFRSTDCVESVHAGWQHM